MQSTGKAVLIPRSEEDGIGNRAYRTMFAPIQLKIMASCPCSVDSPEILSFPMCTDPGNEIKVKSEYFLEILVQYSAKAK
jgi:hypothetical protein